MAEVCTGASRLSAGIICAPTDAANALTIRRKSTGPTLSSKVIPTCLSSTVLRLMPAVFAAVCRVRAEGTAPVTSRVNVSKKCSSIAR